jgi:Fic family protein
VGCLDRAIQEAERAVEAVQSKARFRGSIPDGQVNARQRLMLNKLLDGFEGKLTTMKWGKIAKCSHDSALRGIYALMRQGILAKDDAGGRSTSYRLHPR